MVEARPFASSDEMSTLPPNPFEAAEEGTSEGEVLITPFGTISRDPKREESRSDSDSDGYDSARPSEEDPTTPASPVEVVHREEISPSTDPTGDGTEAKKDLSSDVSTEVRVEESSETLGNEIDQAGDKDTRAINEEPPPVPPRKVTPSAQEDLEGENVASNPSDADDAAPRVPSEEQRKVLMDSSNDLIGSEKEAYCGHIDVETIWNVSDALLVALSRAARNAAEGKPFSSWAKEAADLRPKLIEHLTSTPAKQKTLKDLESVLLQFANSTKRLVGKMFGTHGKAERENQLRQITDELGKLSLQDGGWPMAQRMELAKDLIRRYDSLNVAHCNLGFVDQEKLSMHMADCPWRPVECPNKGCGQVLSFKRLQGHDNHCEYKLVLCVQGCGKQISRMNMNRHITTVCDRKPVVCPFAQYGCSSNVVVCTLQPHLKEKADYHLSLVAVALDEQQLRFENIQNKLRLHDEMLSNQKADHESHTKLLEQLQKDMKPLQSTTKEVVILQKSLKSLSSEMKDLKKQLKAHGSKFESWETRWSGL